MQNNNAILWIAGGVALLLLFFDKNAVANAANVPLDDGTTFDFNNLVADYGKDNVARLSKLYLALQGKGLTRLQIMLMLSQALLETGIFTDSPNYRNTDMLNNYAGIQGNSRYAAGAGSIYAQYPSLNAFVNDWLTVLDFNNEPINAVNVDDFVLRLKENGYFSDNIITYQNGIRTYYQLLNSIIV